MGRLIAPGKLDVDDRLALSIAALINYNQHCKEPSDRWFLSTNAISTAASANPSQRTTPWLQCHPKAQEAIQEHHTAIGLHSRHNGKDKDRGELKAIFDRFVEGKSAEEKATVQRFYQQTD